MRILSLQLKNIRSYVDATVTFNEGTTLLAGDIGSGKSTVLLALEFALFGIQRGTLSGSTLLRHGCQEGLVVLTFSIGTHEYVITRKLKRTSNGVSQDSGSLATNGVLTELTAVELKAKILELLQYPMSQLSKGKGNLFRYTVYTPQEEMKAILMERPDERLDTLRKLFNIDKYKRVRENTTILTKTLREESAHLQGRLEESRKTLSERSPEEERKLLLPKLEEAEQKLAAIVKDHESKEAALAKLEKERFALEEKKKANAITKTRLEASQRRLEELAGERKEIEERIRRTPQKAIDTEKLEEREHVLREHEKKIVEKERALLKQLGEQETIQKQSAQLVASIASLQDCPTCRQEVTNAHKETIKNAENERQEHAKVHMEKLLSVQEELQQRKEQLEEKKNELRQQQQSLAVQRERQRQLDHDKKRLEALLSTFAKLEQECKELKQQPLPPFDEQGYTDLRQLVARQRMEKQEAATAVALLKKDLERLDKEIQHHEERTKEMARMEQALARQQQQRQWLEQHLANVAQVIEKHLFFNSHQLFNGYFRDWLGLLLEDESLTARLDAEFTPVISQNGYETTLENLSGGEKTSVALAYRLALNKVINEFLSTIATQDLLILDEPTDGFSSEQLDRVRAVLAQCGLAQIIIVSHETQVEGYVDHVIRIQKEGHESIIDKRF